MMHDKLKAGKLYKTIKTRCPYWQDPIELSEDHGFDWGTKGEKYLDCGEIVLATGRTRGPSTFGTIIWEVLYKDQILWIPCWDGVLLKYFVELK
jgi:hypothetical protein